MKRKSLPQFKKKDKPPATGWEEYTGWERCSDCDLRDAVDIFGKSHRDHDPYNKRLRRRGLGWKITGSQRFVDDCEGCGGTGRVRRIKKGDPYK